MMSSSELQRALFKLVFAAWIATLSISVVAQQEREMSEQMQLVNESLQTYDKGRDLLMLRKAGEQLEGINQFEKISAERRAQVRLNTLQAWMLILVRVDAAKAKAGSHSPPMTRVAPRNVPGQRPYRPGVDPKEVADPVIRAEYEKAIAENESLRQRSLSDADLQALDIEVSGGAKNFVRRFYTASAADQEELRETLLKAAVDPKRYEQFLVRR
jgi:hypothetical protein